MAIGEINGLNVGQQFETRKDLYEAGVHRTLQAGIVGRVHEGAESIVLSGGYVDDEDYGDEIVYTGFGGRDPNSGRQIEDQEFKAQNQALVTSCLQGTPVRVVRSSSHSSEYSPASNFRYDGLYRVEDYWIETGKDGYKVCRFRLTRQSSEKPKPEQLNLGDDTDRLPSRTITTVQRIVRDTEVGRYVKRLYGHRCQICGVALNCVGGDYAEAAHIKPLGRPHNGPDTTENILCLCPNHHVLFDRGGFTISDDLAVEQSGAALIVHNDHHIGNQYLLYHKQLWQQT